MNRRPLRRRQPGCSVVERKEGRKRARDGGWDGGGAVETSASGGPARDLALVTCFSYLGAQKQSICSEHPTFAGPLLFEALKLVSTSSSFIRGTRVHRVTCPMCPDVRV